MDEGELMQPTRAQDPLSLLAASRFLADEVGDELPLKTGAARTALFLASLAAPGSLPNPFASTRWEPCVYVARDRSGRIVGVLQTALANVALGEGGANNLRTVRFLQNVVVAASWRRRGVASMLVDFAIAADGRFDSALAVEPQNEAALQLYAGRGFELTDEEEREGMRLMVRRRGG